LAEHALSPEEEVSRDPEMLGVFVCYLPNSVLTERTHPRSWLSVGPNQFHLHMRVGPQFAIIRASKNPVEVR